ncbi:MAG: hypothetical protein U5K33_01430 [Halofilum sp. (in: g-proteobacteria)]|nr:hypothetical protein [Halofilum sp. (in: g-proteobacteria)]
MKPRTRQQQPVAIAAPRGDDRRVLALLSGSFLLLLALLLLP